jgi:hypothetical protein
MANSIVSVVALIGAYDKEGKTSVYVIPGEADALSNEAAMPYDRSDAVLILDWCDVSLGYDVAERLQKALVATGLDARLAYLPDD